MRTASVFFLSILVGFVACDETTPPARTPDDGADPTSGSDSPGKTQPKAKAPGPEEIKEPVEPQQAPAPTGRLDDAPAAKTLQSGIESHFASHPGRRIHIQTDKPLYQPGQTIWIKTWDLNARDLQGASRYPGLVYELVSPKGSVAMRKRVRQQGGHATNDFKLPSSMAGGEYTLRVRTMDGHRATRSIVISSYEPPRIKKELEFLRKAYGPGDEVAATIKVQRGTDQPLENQKLTGVVRLDGSTLTKVRAKTNEHGGAILRFPLPEDIERGDGMLTVRVRDGGVTESITRRVPIVLDKMELSFFPEGGDLVEGLPSRVYFSAKKPSGKPGDVKGRIVDDHGNLVARFSSYKNGLGRFSFRPSTGRRYHAEITRPEGIDEKYALPLAKSSGCVLKHFDDPDGQLEAIRVAVRCDEPRKVVVSGFVRNNSLDVAAVKVPEGKPAVVYLEPEVQALARAQGVARVTVFSSDLTPLAERLVYRGRRTRLQVNVEPEHTRYGPRDEAAVDITTRDPQGEPVAARLAMAVVDDKVLSFADDETGHMLSQLLLEPELPGEIEEPNFYLDLTEEKAARALDLLMGTRGYRRFEWKRVLTAQASKGASAAAGDEEQSAAAAARPGPAIPEMREGRRPPVRAEQAQRPERPQAAQPPEEPEAAQAPAAAAMPPQAGRGRALRRPRRRRMLDGAGGGGMAADMALPRQRRRPQWAKVREFPVPDYDGEPPDRRTDFRETLYWNPEIETGDDGKAQVSFPLSDALTSFRVITEGIGGGAAGRDETVFRSTLPFGMTAQLPLQVSAGDTLEIPLVLMNERRHPIDVDVHASFGELLTPAEGTEPSQTITIQPGKRASRFFRVKVTGKRGESTVRFEGEAAGLSDEFERTVQVAPRGFPRKAARSGQLERKVQHTVDLSRARKGSVVGTLQVYPSPVSTMTAGLEGMLREPHGCFEQASSTNYPNVMLMRYLDQQGVAAPELVQRAQKLMEPGYRKLVGYESKGRGYEWFGGNPAHEALTAYGLLEFVDMQKAWGQVDRSMIERTEKWLLDRRDGNGGFKRNPKALDSFGNASPEVTNAYITYSLTEAGRREGLDAQIAKQAKVAKSTDDAYVLALAANTLVNVSKTDQAQGALRRLLSMQNGEGAWKDADHSITRSTGKNLHIETTALATLALLEADGHAGPVRNAVKWLNGQRDTFGGYGATQATVLTLKALTRYAEAQRRMQSGGTLRVVVNDGRPGEVSFEAGRKEPLEIPLTEELVRGENTVRITRTKGKRTPLPYTLSVQYRTEQPATSAQAPVSLETELHGTDLDMGDSVRLTAKVTNTTKEGRGMTLARIGLPGGLTHQGWQLDELKERGVVDFYETREREITLYFRDMKPEQTKTVPLELTTTVPGDYRGPASRAYLYYSDEHKHWTAPLRASIAR